MEVSRLEWLKSEWGRALLTVSVLLVILFGLVWAWTEIGVALFLVVVVLQLVTLWGLHDQWDGFIRRTWANTEEAKQRLTSIESRLSNIEDASE